MWHLHQVNDKTSLNNFSFISELNTSVIIFKIKCSQCPTFTIKSLKAFTSEAYISVNEMSLCDIRKK